VGENGAGGEEGGRGAVGERDEAAGGFWAEFGVPVSEDDEVGDEVDDEELDEEEREVWD